MLIKTKMLHYKGVRLFDCLFLLVITDRLHSCSAAASPFAEIGDVTLQHQTLNREETLKPGVYLTANQAEGDGLLFALSADFYNNQAMTIQIYQPISTSQTNISMQLRLVYELPVTPSVMSGREDIYIESQLTKKCLYIKKGYRLAVHFGSKQFSVKYAFDYSTYKLVKSATKVSVGEIQTFDSLEFPYKLALSAHIYTADTAVSSSNATLVNCVPGLVIPSRNIASSTSAIVFTTQVTGKPGAVGDTGPQGFTGFVGPDGPGGSSGFVGYTGATGNTGYTGSRLPGATGIGGDMGVGGAVGMIGSTGMTGSVGSQGSTGGTGLEGLPGLNLVVRVGKPTTSSDITFEPPYLASLSQNIVTDFWSRDESVIAVYIWLSIISFLLCLSLVCLISLAGMFRSTFSFKNIPLIRSNE